MIDLPAKQIDEWADIADSDEDKELKEKHDKYQRALEDSSLAKEYLSSKGWESEDIKSVGLGYCKHKQALVIPIYTGSANSILLGFLYRDIKKTPSGFAVIDELNIEPSEVLVGDPKYSIEGSDLLLVSDPLDLYRLQHIAKDQPSAAILGNQLSEHQKKRLKELKPKRIIFIRGTDTTAKELAEEVRKFCLRDLVYFSLISLSAADVSEHLKTKTGEDTLMAKIDAARTYGGLLDHGARSVDELFSALAAQPPALKTGYKNLDKKIRIPVGAVTIVAGRPKHGKTTFMYNLMVQMIESGLYDDKKFYFFSYEESGVRIKQKILSRLLEASDVKATEVARIYGFTDIRSGEDLIQQYALKRQEEPGFRVSALDAAIGRLEELLPRFEVVNERLTVEALDEMIRKLNEREAIGAIFIDYMQRIPTEKERNTIRENMNHVSDALKWCANETGLPLIVGAQINRTGTEKVGKDKKGKRPAQTDIKESGNLEEDANLALCVYNETQAGIDDGDESAISKAENEHYVSVYTLNSRDSEPSETNFIMTNRLFRE